MKTDVGMGLSFVTKPRMCSPAGLDPLLGSGLLIPVLGRPCSYNLAAFNKQVSSAHLDLGDRGDPGRWHCLHSLWQTCVFIQLF